MARSQRVDIFSYLDFRLYLRDEYDLRKRLQRGFSYRWFAKKAGLSSPNFLQLVIQSKRNLSTETAMRFAEALGLDPTESRFFCDLVGFNQATTAADKNAHYERLSGYRKHRAVRALEHSEFEYYSKWYVPVIREMVTCAGFTEDPETIAAQLIPPITPAQASQAIELLLRLGFLVRAEGGTLSQADPLLSTGPEVRSLAVGNFHRQMMERAAASIELVEREWRDISALTVALGPETFKMFKQKIVALRKELLELSASEKRPSKVIQMNFQLFPMASTEEKKP